MSTILMGSIICPLVRPLHGKCILHMLIIEKLIADFRSGGISSEISGFLRGYNNAQRGIKNLYNINK